MCCYYVMVMVMFECCAALLAEQHLANEDTADAPRPLGNSLTKILYILHWMLIDAASECQDYVQTTQVRKPILLLFSHYIFTTLSVSSVLVMLCCKLLVV